jgi:ribosomal protein L34
VTRLATASGHEIVLSRGSETRDRIIIAGTAVAGVALIVAFVLYRRQRRQRQPLSEET